jgi:hypothetical protein
MTVHIMGIRHHGPGSARSTLLALQRLQPDCILVEGPPDADHLIPLVIAQGMQPPVGILIYQPDVATKAEVGALQRAAVYYPFALFSPEWQALSYGILNNVDTRFMDLPQAHAMAVQEQLMHEMAAAQAQAVPDPNLPPPAPDPDMEQKMRIRADPLRWLAEAAGYTDSERWWEQMVEQRRDNQDTFPAVYEAMSTLRAEVENAVGVETNPYEILREAHMRHTIREAVKAGRQRIAVICGAWHASALNLDDARFSAKQDQALLKGMPKVKVAATWIPWTYGRLSRSSGYGAGITSPGWYQHLWNTPRTSDIAPVWLANVARLLREQRLDASTALVIDGVRLAETLAALRELPIPGLDELNEATMATLCFGSDVPMKLIQEKLIVGDRLGHVPEGTPSVPLQQDIDRLSKSLRLPQNSDETEYDLDLREENGLKRSVLLHRLTLLEIKWGALDRRSNKTGTFRESWKVKWEPEFAVRIVEANLYGNTVLEAASNFAVEQSEQADLPALTAMLGVVMLADLPQALQKVMVQVQNVAALTTDVAQLMDALPNMARVLRYGDVRGTDLSMVQHVLDGFVSRIGIGLPNSCAALDDDAAEIMFKRILATHGALTNLNNSDYLSAWYEALGKLLTRDDVHGMLGGRAARILFDVRNIPLEEVERLMRLSLARAADPAMGAAWIEGFLHGSGTILMHDDNLWRALDEWLSSLDEPTFVQTLPLLRRTFSTFPHGERQQIGERARHGRQVGVAAATVDPERGARTLATLAKILGVG